MFKISLNEIMALSLVLEYSTVEDLLKAAADTFHEENNDRSKEQEDACVKALETFLNC